MIRFEGIAFAKIGPIDLAVAHEGLTVVVGPNGAGKSLLLKMMHGLVKPAAGKIARGSGAPTVAEQAYVASELGFLDRTVEDNLVWLMRIEGMGKHAARSHAEGLLDAAGLLHLRDRPAMTLSAGEQALLGLARGLVPQPRLLLLDEPTAHLDPAATKIVEEVIADVRGRGQGIIMTTHDMGQARRLAEQLVILVNGSVAAAGPVEEILANPPTEAAAVFLAGGLVA